MGRTFGFRDLFGSAKGKWSGSTDSDRTVEEVVFDFFDRNGDGKISPVELRRCIRKTGCNLSVIEAEAAIESFDSDGDGLLSPADFRNIWKSESEEELKEAFEMYSTKPGSGCISPSSLRRMMARLGESTSLAHCKAMIRPFDLNADGFLSFHEFSLMMRMR